LRASTDSLPPTSTDVSDSQLSAYLLQTSGDYTPNQKMKRSCFFLFVAALLAATSIGVLFDFTGRAREVMAQDVEKSLDIQRYNNEPLALVDIRINEKSIRGGIKINPRNATNHWGRDNVKFKDKEDWFKHLKIKLRNISGRPIYGLRAELRFQHPNQRLLFGLPLMYKKKLDQEPLQPDEDIELEVNEALFNQTIDTMRQHGVEPSLAAVTLSVDSASFNDDLEWSRGKLLRRDPNDRKKWNTVDKPVPPNGASLMKKQTGFTLISFNHYPVQTDNFICQADYGGRLGYQCTDDYTKCLRITELGDGVPGYLSDEPEISYCIYEQSDLSCQTRTIHSVLEYDSSCPTPGPAPTPGPSPTPCQSGLCDDPNAIQVDFCNPDYPVGTGCPAGYTRVDNCCLRSCAPSNPPPCNGLLIPPGPPFCWWTCIPRSTPTPEREPWMSRRAMGILEFSL
jgi:hypothetical protein